MRLSVTTLGVGVTLVTIVALSVGGCGQPRESESIEDVAGLELVSFDIGGMT